MKPVVQIPEPCSEDWNKMTPETQGRFCDKCCKVVVDFTEKTTTEIVDFLKAKINDRVCGRFRSDQVLQPAVATNNRPSFHFRQRTKVFLAALYLVFGGFLFSSCSTIQPVGEIEPLAGAVAYVDDTLKPNHLTGDTIIPEPIDTNEVRMQGEIAAPQIQGDVELATPQNQNCVPQNEIHIKMGKVAPPPPTVEPEPPQTLGGAPILLVPDPTDTLH